MWLHQRTVTITESCDHPCPYLDPAMYPLYRYVGGVKQGAELLQGIEELVPSQATPTINSDKLEKVINN